MVFGRELHLSLCSVKKFWIPLETIHCLGVVNQEYAHGSSYWMLRMLGLLTNNAVTSLEILSMRDESHRGVEVKLREFYHWNTWGFTEFV